MTGGLFLLSCTRDLAIKEGKRADGRKVIKRDESEYPEKCPFTFEQILDETWYPN